MTITTQAAATTQEGNGVTTVWPFNFIVPYQNDGVTPAIVVTTTDSLGNVTTLSPSVYSTTGLNDPAGGSITYPLSGTPLPTGSSITIYRALNYTQDTQILNTSFYPHTTEQIADRIEMQMQQLREQVARAVVFPSGETGTGNELPPEVLRKSMFPWFNSSGKLTLVTSIAGVIASAFGAAWAMAVDGIAALGMLGVYPTMAAAMASPFATLFPSITLKGYYVDGDLGGARWLKTTGPAAAGKRQNSDGSWWVLGEPTVYANMLGAKMDNTTDDVVAIQEAADFCFGTAAAPHGTSSWLNKPLGFFAGRYKITSGILFTGVRGALIFGAMRWATEIRNTSGGAVFRFNGIGYSSIANFYLEAASITGTVLDVDWDHVSPQSTQQTSFFNIFTQGGQYGCNIGAAGYQASELDFYTCNFANAHDCGIAVQNQNALSIRLWGGELADNAIGARVFAGSLHIFGTAMQGNTVCDYQVDNQAQDAICIHGVRSESTNFLSLQNNISASIQACSHLGSTNGYFLTGGMTAVVEGCTSTHGNFQNSPNVSISNSRFGRNDLVSSTDLNGCFISYKNVWMNINDTSANWVFIFDSIRIDRATHGPLSTKEFVTRLTLTPGGGTTQFDMPKNARVMRVAKCIDTVGAAGTVNVGDTANTTRYFAGADLTTANEFVNSGFLCPTQTLVKATVTGAAGVVGEIVVEWVPNAAGQTIT